MPNLRYKSDFFLHGVPRSFFGKTKKEGGTEPAPPSVHPAPDAAPTPAQRSCVNPAADPAASPAPVPVRTHPAPFRCIHTEYMRRKNYV